jgi:hypothetical protein
MSLKDGSPLTISEALGVMYQAVDTLKRPLMEESSSDEAKLFASSQGTVFNQESNRNPDLRRGFPTNSLALADILARRSDFLSDLVWVHNHVLAANPNQSIGRRALFSSWVASAASSFGINRVDNPFQVRSVPVEAAHLFKASLGLRGVAPSLLLEDSPTGERYYQKAVDDGLLIDSGLSCPASRNLIAQSAEAIMYGIGPRSSTRMDELFPDFRRLQSYSWAFYIINNLSHFPGHNIGTVTREMNAALGRF